MWTSPLLWNINDFHLCWCWRIVAPLPPPSPFPCLPPNGPLLATCDGYTVCTLAGSHLELPSSPSHSDFHNTSHPFLIWKHPYPMYYCISLLVWSELSSLNTPLLRVIATVVAIHQQLCIWIKCRLAAFCQTKCFQSWRETHCTQSVCHCMVSSKSWCPICQFHLIERCYCMC